MLDLQLLPKGPSPKGTLHFHNQSNTCIMFGFNLLAIRLPAVEYSKGYSKALEYEYRVKTAALGTLKRYSILSLTLYLE
jgi:hypothetical protein